MAGRPLRRARAAINNPTYPSFGQRLYHSAQYKMYTDGPHPSSIDDGKHQEGGYRDMCIKALATFLTLEESGLPLRDAVEYTSGSVSHIAAKVGDQYFVVWITPAPYASMSDDSDVMIEKDGGSRVRWSEWSKSPKFPATHWFRKAAASKNNPEEKNIVWGGRRYTLSEYLARFERDLRAEMPEYVRDHKEAVSGRVRGEREILAFGNSVGWDREKVLDKIATGREWLQSREEFGAGLDKGTIRGMAEVYDRVGRDFGI